MVPETRRRIIRIPLTALGMLIMQAALVLMWATQLDARVNEIEQQIVSNRSLNEKFARLEERLDNVKQGMSEVKHQIEQLTQSVMKKQY